MLVIKKINKIFILLAAAVLLSLTGTFAFAGSANAAYNPNGAACGGANGDPASSAGSTDPSACDPENGKSLADIAAWVINLFSWIVGVVSVIMIIYGGFRYITSGGDSNGVTAAKNTILYAIIGLVIVALSQLIVRFILGRLTTVGLG